ncbi:MAG TPA: flagellar hook-basal body complex protein FliE [Fimbriimonadaceae bacterium]|nr:flagellar hook-basal body complex protein FliE [Fimbriimonadaceae bacterium]HRJ95382.1 flagellar hook-basal body complex protein FliE [Fimbriimonadaceae bacterium]
MRIDATPNVTKVATEQVLSPKSEKSGDFGEMLMDVLKEVNQGQQDARSKGEAFMAGQPVDIDEMMITMERASVAMQLTLQVRNKLLEAYQEIARMQV